MTDTKETVVIRANVELPTAALETIVRTAKRLGRRDTADLVGEMISRFLLGHDFERFVHDVSNYSD